jgi:23S rRNA pseudouridine2605 synthase
MAAERLQKILARAGVASRRKAEELILAGRVRVDGEVVTELGTRADPRSSRVELDGKKLVAEPLVYGVLHKPRGMVSTLSDPEGRPTVRQLLARIGARVVPVGRLDFHTSGALLFTNDGDFAAKLAHPSTKAPKVYVAKVKGSLDEQHLTRWCESIEIDGRRTRPADVRVLRDEGDKTWLEITLREGRNRQVRRLGDHAGTPVMRLARISQAGITSEGLRPGQWRWLTVDELTALKRTFGVPRKVRSPATSGLPQPTRGAVSARRPGARPAGTRPAGSRPAGSRPAGSRSAEGRPAASRAPGGRPSAARSEGARPAGSRAPSASAGAARKARPAGSRRG